MHVSTMAVNILIAAGTLTTYYEATNLKLGARMADINDENDIYNDPATIGNVANDETPVNGAPDKLPPEHAGDPSQSIFTPEKDTTDLDDRGTIDELELTDAKDSDIGDETIDTALLDDAPTEIDGDSYHLSRDEPADEQDNTYNP